MVVAQRSARVARYLEEHPAGFPVLIDERRGVAKAYGVWHRLGLDAINIARPALFVIDANGVVQSIYVGESQAEFPGHDAIVSDLLLPPSSPP